MYVKREASVLHTSIAPRFANTSETIIIYTPSKVVFHQKRNQRALDIPVSEWADGTKRISQKA